MLKMLKVDFICDSQLSPSGGLIMNRHTLVSHGQTAVFASSKSMNEVGDGTIDFIITSPPYWNLKAYGSSPDEIGHGDYDDYLGDLATVWAECYRKARVGTVLVINVNSRRSKGKFYPIAFDIVRTIPDWTFWDHNIWYVPNALPQPNTLRSSNCI